MVKRLDEYCQKKLRQRQASESLRSLEIADTSTVDFYSNDYLGLAAASRNAKPGIDQDDEPEAIGSTGSRLLSGNSRRVELLETDIAKFHGFEAGLLFNSGYDANLGLLACLAQRTDSVILDALAHASIVDGASLSRAKRLHFRHNDLDDLDVKLRHVADGRPDGAAIVVVEGTYSMGGDHAPLLDIANLCDSYGAALVVDEAHSIGVEGPHGEGLVATLGLQDRVLATVYTFGKALGCHGALVAGPAWLRSYLINFCRPFIYSTAPSPASVATISQQHTRMRLADVERNRLKGVINHFRTRCESLKAVLLPSSSAIQAILVPGNSRALALERALKDEGFAARAIRSPTVPSGSERIRICLHVYNTFAEIDGLVDAISSKLLDCKA